MKYSTGTTTVAGSAFDRQTLTLTSLAILQVDIDAQHRDYVDYLGSFVISLIATRNPDIVTDSTITGLLRSEFGLNVPLKAAQHVLRRLAKRGFLTKAYGAFSPSPTMPRIDLSSRRADAERRIEAVYTAICEFAAQTQQGLIWAHEDAAHAVLSFLGYFTVDCLKTYVFNTALPHIPETSPKELYIVGRFLQNAYHTTRPLFENFIVLVKGQMYANALTCPDLESLDKKFNKVRFFLDTPLVLDLLELQGTDALQAAEELIYLLKDLKGSVALFAHTLEETRSVIRFAIQNYDNPYRANRVLREVRKRGLSYILLVHEHIMDTLASYDITIRPTPEYNASLQISETEFEALLEEEIEYKGEQALLNDINSVRSIYVLRAGIEPVRLEDCVAIFVTRNADYAKAAFNYGITQNSSREVSPVITAYSLANVAWLKAPMTRPTLPEKQTLALCYAVLEPTKELVRKYVQTMDSLKETGQISPDDHAILRVSSVAHQELMNLTLGDEEALTGSSIHQILERAKASIVQEHTELFETTNKERESRYKLLEEERDRLLATETARRERLWKYASRAAGTITRVIAIVSTLIISVGMVTAAGLIPLLQSSGAARYGLFVSVGCVLVWGLWSWESGATLQNTRRNIEAWCRSYLYRLISKEDAPPSPRDDV